MNRITNILTVFSLAILSLGASAYGQSSGSKVTANIPFEFSVGAISLPAGQYEFLQLGDNKFQIRSAEGRSVLILAAASISDENSEKSFLRFGTVDGRHVLLQIFNGNTESGKAFLY